VARIPQPTASSFPDSAPMAVMDKPAIDNALNGTRK
jgi:hypothetical protein